MVGDSERGEKAEGGVGVLAHLPGITVSLNRGQPPFLRGAWLLQVSLAATTDTTTEFPGDWGVKVQKKINKREGDSYTL